MTAPLPDFKHSLVDWIDQDDAFDDHPGDATLSLFARSELEEAAAEAVRAHLVGCRQCLEEVVILRSARGKSADNEATAFWQKLSPRLAASEGAPAPVLPMPRRAPAVAWLPLALAAMLVAGLGWRLLQLEEQLQESRAPRSNVDLVDLSSQLSTARGEKSPQNRLVADRGGLLLLHSLALRPDMAYQVRLQTAAGRRLTDVVGLRVEAPDLNLALWLPPDFLDEGDYELILMPATDSGEAEELDRWSLKVGEDTPR